MKTFARHRTLAELKPLCAQRNIAVDTTRHDVIASDFITLSGKFGIVDLMVIYSVFNGTFYGETSDGLAFNERSPFDDTPWFAALLELLYVAKPVEAAHG
ncbi:hypothetical protein [Roseomonas genomospecies 6]|uniref:Uncharacterized protein n=1 Tax=Roseomonas genomospecies 6 TaxID=214106 RepID=A0A9W7NGL4_9PROT|nr:hypothetical protein [Roseomonas genomospecies 6]KAA0678103.1 hypothetical protein DS843_21205 [Roseomonas genomospecies 6]